MRIFYYLAFLLFAIFLSCTNFNKEQIELITKMVDEPQSISKIVEKDSTKFTDFFKKEIKLNKAMEILKDYFSDYQGKYKIIKVFDDKDQYGLRRISYYVINFTFLYTSEFRFIEENNRWKFHHIILPEYYKNEMYSDSLNTK